MVIAFRDFSDEEYFVTREVLEVAGIKVVTASIKTGVAMGSQGGEAAVDAILSEVNVSDFDGVIFIGGAGAHKHINDPKFHRLAKETLTSRKLLAAICIAPAILAEAGALKGKRATVWSSATGRSAIEILESNGALYQPDAVVQDGNIITANGPAAAQEFGKVIIETLLRDKY